MTEPKGGKAPHPIVVNTGDEPNGNGPQAPPATGQAQETNPPAGAPHTAPQAAQAPELGQYVVELQTVEAMLAKHSRGQAKRELLVCVVAGAALLLAAGAYRRATAEQPDAD